MIEFRNVHKAFGPKRILQGLSLTIEKGKTVFILGRSGTGKSVALKHLVGLLSPDQGEIYLDQEPLHQYSEEQFEPIRRRCNIVFQLPALIDSRSCFENLTFGIRNLPLAEKIQRCEHSLNDVNLAHLAPEMGKKFPPQLSYGEQKRLAIARALVLHPDYILFDEPTTGLDPDTSRVIHELIRSITDQLGRTSVVVSHDMRNALKTADYIYVLHAGQVADKGTPQEILSSKHPLTLGFLADLNRGALQNHSHRGNPSK